MPSCGASFNRRDFQTTPLQVQINGESRELSHEQINLGDLVRELSLAPQRIAVELNKRIVRRDDWEQTAINEGDHLEIVHFVGGGAETLPEREGAFRRAPL